MEGQRGPRPRPTFCWSYDPAFFRSPLRVLATHSESRSVCCSRDTRSEARPRDAQSGQPRSISSSARASEECFFLVRACTRLS